MQIGLVLLALVSLATAVVRTPEQLIAIRAAMGVAAAMTTPGSMALAFRLFDDDALRVRAITLISTAGLVGLGVGPTVGGLVLAVSPWQVLLLVNAPIAVVALIGIRRGIGPDRAEDLHGDPIDVIGAVLGTVALVLALLAPTLLVSEGAASWPPWTVLAGAVASGALFVRRQRTARHPLLDLALLARPLVASGLVFKAAAGLATAGMGYLVTLQLQLQLGWSPALASIGMLPQVVVLLLGGAFVNRFVQRVGHARAAWLSALAVVAGLATYAALNSFGYVWIALSLALVAAGMRVVGVVAATNVMTGLPESRTTMGAGLADTATQIANGTGIALAGTVIAALFTGSIASPGWSGEQAEQFQAGITGAAALLTVVAAALVGWGFSRTRRFTLDRR